MNIVLLGPPGSGKDTQSTILAECLGVPHISIGTLLRAVEPESELGKNIHSIIDAGFNVGSDILLPMLLRAIASCKDGFVLNNFPRSLEQLNTWKKILAEGMIKIDHVVALEVPPEVGIARMVERAERSAGVGKTRGDEREDVLKKRKEVGYDEAAQAVISFYEGLTRVHRIDGTPPIDEVAATIWSAIHG